MKKSIPLVQFILTIFIKNSRSGRDCGVQGGGAGGGCWGGSSGSAAHSRSHTSPPPDHRRGCGPGQGYRIKTGGFLDAKHLYW